MDNIIQFWDDTKKQYVEVSSDNPLPISVEELDIGTSNIEDGSVTTAKIADKSITQEKISDALMETINSLKFTPLSGSSNSANSITEPGVYFNIGGYGLQNAPRGNYGWMLIVTRGTSNGHHKGGQIYFDLEGLEWRGFDGSTFTEWETCIVKNKLTDIEPIADPTTATVEDLANAYNALLEAMKG